MKTISELQVEVHENAKAHGWWETPPTPIELLMLIVSELSEALEELRHGSKVTEVYFANDGKPEGFLIELADVVLRIMDLCEYYKLNLERACIDKHKYNLSRPYKHGGKTL